MIDLYLRADTEAALKEALAFAVSPEGDWMPCGSGWALDPIGALERAPGDTDARFHANLRLLDPALEALVPEAIRVSPTAPRRVWA